LLRFKCLLLLSGVHCTLQWHCVKLSDTEYGFKYRAFNKFYIVLGAMLDDVINLRMMDEYTRQGNVVFNVWMLMSYCNTLYGNIKLYCMLCSTDGNKSLIHYTLYG